ncbi:uncharacterized protein G2W53_019377 [Senna tora]|uniref:Uncharacterized protein n=1 Tax=Senna tora TaxID=362788 RepID=A0A834WP60_9FABA|nr:uncharacterized protein G2W53_019377 [Senna tora]
MRVGLIFLGFIYGRDSRESDRIQKQDAFKWERINIKEK